MPDNSENNRRIAKNTMLLYLRMLLLMFISLYTSRVVLQSLGVEDFGLYNAVGGFVSMFGILTTTLSASIGRFITVELGKGNMDRLATVFSTSLKIQLLMSIVIAVLVEVLGMWFVCNKMQIPEGREYAARWVLHCSVISFMLSLLFVPYIATIIAHERMSTFAYVSILEAVMKLGMAFLLLIVTPADKLVFFAWILLIGPCILLALYIVYCRRNFPECRGNSVFDRSIFKEMFQFAGWSFLGNTAFVFNTQGVNMLMNVYFGVVVNAARGLANQVNSAVSQFVGNFTTAVNPQIIKYYASGDTQSAYTLVCRGAKFSFLLMLTLSLPILFEVDQILHIWLKTPPDGTSEFVIWTILASLSGTLGGTLLTLINADGDIRLYQIVITLCGFSPFPLTWIAFKLGASAIWAYFIYFIIYYILVFVRLYLVHQKTGIPYGLYFKEVIFRTHIVALVASLAPFIAIKLLPPTIARLFLTCFLCLASCAVSVYCLGLTRGERTLAVGKMKALLLRIIR